MIPKINTRVLPMIPKIITNLQTLLNKLTVDNYLDFLNDISKDGRKDEPEYNRWNFYRWNILGFAAWLSIDQLGYTIKNRITYMGNDIKHSDILKVFGNTFCDKLYVDIDTPRSKVSNMSTMEYVDYFQDIITDILKSDEDIHITKTDSTMTDTVTVYTAEQFNTDYESFQNTRKLEVQKVVDKYINIFNETAKQMAKGEIPFGGIILSPQHEDKSKLKYIIESLVNTIKGAGYTKVTWKSGMFSSPNHVTSARSDYWVKVELK